MAPAVSDADRGVRTLVVWCPDWPLVAAGVPLDEPAVVLHANRVVACSPGARAAGVAVGLRRREAQARCPSVRVLDHDPVTDARRFEPVLIAVETFTPRLEVTAPGSCAVVTRGPSRYFGGDDRLARLVQGAVDEALAGMARGSGSGSLTPRCRVGVADGSFAATLAARRASDDPRVVAPGDTPAFLAPLPLAVLADDRPDLVDVLARLGLRTLGELAALPAGSVVGRFGSVGETAHRLASGLDERPPLLAGLSPDLAVSAILDPPADRVDRVAFVAKALADEVTARLGALGLACTRVAIEAETEHGERHERLWRHQDAFDAAALADRARWQLEGWLQGPARARPTAGVSRLVLVPDELRAATGRQLGFWGEETDAAERALRALTRIEGLLGAEAVTVPEWRGGRGVADRVVLVPVGVTDLTDRSGGAIVGSVDARSVPWAGQMPAPSPAGVHLPLRTAQVHAVDGAPVAVDGRGALSAPPARVAVDGGALLEVAAWAGPWLLDERWWDDTRHRRRAHLQVVTSTGVAYLLTLERSRWWCEATYD